MKHYGVLGQKLIEYEMEVSEESAEEAEQMLQDVSIADVLECENNVKEWWCLDDPEVSEVEEIEA